MSRWHRLQVLASCKPCMPLSLQPDICRIALTSDIRFALQETCRTFRDILWEPSGASV